MKRRINARFFFAVCLSSIEVVKDLIEDGADINSRDDIFFWKGKEKDEVYYAEINSNVDRLYTLKNGSTALAYAVKRKYIEMVELLCTNGADVNAGSLRDSWWTDTLSSSTYNETPLMNAASCDSIQIAKILVNHGAKVDLKDTDGQTALFYASRSNKLELVKFLIESGADINILNNSGKSVIEVLYDMIEEYSDTLRTYGPYYFLDYLSIAEYLVQKKADLHRINKSKEEFITIIKKNIKCLEDEIKNKNWSKGH